MITIKFDYFIWLALAVITAMIMYFIPPDMDDYNQYHALSCWFYPNAVMHTFRESCNGLYDLSQPPFLWTRAYGYVGAAYSLMYYPIFLLWPSWQSPIVLGVVLVALSVFAFVRMFHVRLGIALLALCGNFPILYYIIRDHGQITIQFCLLYVLPWLVFEVASSKKISVWLSLSFLIGFLLAFGVESKPVLIYLVPSMAIVTVAVCWSICPNFYHLALLLLRRLWPGMLLACVFLTVLLTATVPNGETYYHSLAGLVPKSPTLWEGFVHGLTLVRVYLLNFPNNSAIAYGWFDWRGELITLPLWLLGGVATFIYLRKDSGSKRMVVALVMAFCVGVFICGMDMHSKNPHHILQSFYFLLGAFAIILQSIFVYSQRIFKVLASVLIFLQITCTWFIVSHDVKQYHNWDRIYALDYIRDHKLAERAVVDHVDWGIYYQSALYGPREQLVTFQAPYEKVVDMAHKLNRNMVFIRTVVNRHELASFPAFENIAGLHRVYPEEGKQSTWEVWTDLTE